MKDGNQKKILIVATVVGFFRFLKNDIRILQSMGYEVHCATNFNEAEENPLEDMQVQVHQINFSRSPFSPKVIRAYLELKKLMKENHFDAIHCHTPVGGVVTRLCARKYRKNGTVVLYTAHGFHFFKGSSKSSWIVFYPLERYLSKYTDVIITINTEDYELATKKFHSKEIIYVAGVGIDTKKFHHTVINIDKKRNDFKVKSEDIFILSVGELSKRKNHITAIKALGELKKISGFEKVHYYIAGTGPLENDLKSIVKKLGLERNVKFLGYRTDISELCQAADLFLFPSLQEGLPVALMEAIACEVPVFCSKIRGNEDLIFDSNNMFEPQDVGKLKKLLLKNMTVQEKRFDRVTLKNNMLKSVTENYNKLKKFSITEVEKK